MITSFPKCPCGGVAVSNASDDITRTCVRCGKIIKPQYRQKLGAGIGVIEQIFYVKEIPDIELTCDEFVDEVGPLPECPRCGLAVGVCECAEIEEEEGRVYNPKREESDK